MHDKRLIQTEALVDKLMEARDDMLDTLSEMNIRLTAAHEILTRNDKDVDDLLQKMKLVWEFPGDSLAVKIRRIEHTWIMRTKAEELL